MAGVSERMRLPFAAFLLAGALFLAGAPAGAHPSPSSQVFLSVGGDRLHAEVTLPVDELKLAFPVPLLDASGRWSMASDARVAAYVAAHVRPVAPDGRAWTVKVTRVRWELERRPADIVADVVLRPPAGAPLGTLDLGIDVISHQVPNHITLVALKDGTGAVPRMLGSLHYGQNVVAIRDAAPHWWTGCGDLFKLGMTPHRGGCRTTCRGAWIIQLNSSVLTLAIRNERSTG
ncbi:hypothetical protein, partial [Massilia phosphatilytica]